MNLGEVLYDNLARQAGATIAWSGETLPSFPPRNALDWRDFSVWRITEPGVLEVTLLIGGAVDSWALWTRTNNGLAATATLQLELSAGVFTTVDSPIILAVGSSALVMRRLTQSYSLAAGRKVRLVIGGASSLDVRQFAFGERLTFEVGQYGGIKPPTLLHGVVVTNVIATNGSIIGRSIRREERSGEISLQPVTREWVRTSWEPFALHASRYAFFYLWNPTEYPDEACFAVAENINAPENVSPVPRMKVTMPLRILAD